MTPTARRRWLVRGAILVSIALSGTAAVGVVLNRLEALSAPVPSVLGIRLGATPDEVRALRGGTDWVSRVDSAGDLELVRERERYSFHEGLLVALDVTLSVGEVAPPSQMSSASVLLREDGDTGVRVQWVSRSCPTHAASAAALVDRLGR